ncbi:MAG: helix-turn-helix domain-containing protein [Bacilli bacterium]|nr:helix-turn-helix domain-containing protein [Bacilli bacterium]
MKKNDFGKYTAKLRIMHNQTQTDMANILSVSCAFLSKVESGSAKPILAWVDILSENYSLSPEETGELRKIVLTERAKGASYIKNLTIDDQNLVTLLIARISDMPPEKKEKIKKLISE